MDNFENVDDYDVLSLILQAAAILEEREANADTEIITIDDDGDSEDMDGNGQAIVEAAIQENAANSKGNVTVDGDNSADTGDEVIYLTTVPELMQPWPQDVAERRKALDIEDMKKVKLVKQKLAKFIIFLSFLRRPRVRRNWRRAERGRRQGADRRSRMLASPSAKGAARRENNRQDNHSLQCTLLTIV